MVLLDAGQIPRTQRQVLEQLIGEIDSGALKPGDPIGNDVALAGRFGVSRNTIRSLMSTLEEAEAVRQVPRCGIFLNAPIKLSSVPVTPADRKECLYIRWCDSLMESEICCGLERFARTHALAVNVLAMHQSEELLRETLDHLAPGSTAVLAPVETPAVAAALNRALERGVRILQVDRYLAGVKAPAIVFDDYSAGVLATRHLIRQVSQPVWYFGYFHPVSAEKRFLGWRDSMRESGFRNIEDYIIPCACDDVNAEKKPGDFYRDAFRAFYRGRLDQRLAIFCMCDALALDVYAVAAEFGRRVGDDLRIVGSGDIACDRRQDPPLSSVHVEQERLGEAAGQLLLRWPSVPNYCQILPLELVERESSLGSRCGTPPEKGERLP